MLGGGDPLKSAIEEEVSFASWYPSLVLHVMFILGLRLVLHVMYILGLGKQPGV
jgi:hypothetical protein